MEAGVRWLWLGLIATRLGFNSDSLGARDIEVNLGATSTGERD